MKKWFPIWKAPPILQERQTVKSQATKKWGSISFVHDSISPSGVNAGLVKRYQYWIRHDAGSKKGGKTRPVVVVMV